MTSAEVSSLNDLSWGFGSRFFGSQRIFEWPIFDELSLFDFLASEQHLLLSDTCFARETKGLWITSLWGITRPQLFLVRLREFRGLAPKSVFGGPAPKITSPRPSLPSPQGRQSKYTIYWWWGRGKIWRAALVEDLCASVLYLVQYFLSRSAWLWVNDDWGNSGGRPPDIYLGAASPNGILAGTPSSGQLPKTTYVL